jgi:SWI/SNF-related matrix-associated actin-dependent regulator 1 of chromatin subfamily A
VTAYLHQREGATWLAGRKRALLTDDCGLGKTGTALETARLLGNPQMLVISPAIVRSHWLREASRVGYPLNRIEVISYDEAVRGGRERLKDLLRGGRVGYLWLDEFHYCKHHTSLRSQIVLGKNAAALAYQRFVPTVHGGSGTPMPRNPLELWTIVASMFPAVAVKHGISTTEQWTEHFCVTRPVRTRGVWRDKVVGAKNVETLRAILAEISLRRTAGDVGLDVPQLDFQVLPVDVKADAQLGMDQVLAEKLWLDAQFTGDLEAIAKDPHVARMRRRLGELKVGPVLEMVRDALEQSDEKLVLYAQHTNVLHALRDELKEYKPAFIDGSVGPKARDTEKDRFVMDPECRVFIGQNQACQTGLDGLHKVARRAVLVEPDWAPDVNYQLGKRIARIGSVERRHCIAQMVTLANTLDEAIVAQNVRETRMVNEVMG